jgi:signal transduction histidine kinase
MASEADFIPQRGELAALIRAKDWAETPLGAADGWPASLRTVLRLMVTSRYAMWMGWGPDLVFFYNDTYAQQTLGAKHPWALGRPAREVWAEIWGVLEPRILHVLKTGEATWDEGLRLFLERNGYPEETYHTFSYSPAPGDAPDDSAGLFCVVIEETERVIGERRIALLRDLASSLGQTKTSEGVFAAVEQCLGADMRDIPFSLTYLFEEGGMIARRATQTAFGAAHAAAPELASQAEGALWPLRAVYESGSTLVVDLANVRDLPTGFWDRPPARALVVPIPQQGQARPAGVFIAGLNPHRPLDEGLRSFVELFVGQLAAGLANAGAYEEARKRAEALAEIDRVKTAFFSNVSHEFRTPLTLMLGPTEDALASPARALHGAELETVYRNELRLLKLVNGLLDFARIEAGRMQASYEPVDLHQLTVDLTSTFRSAIERAGLELEVDSAPLPEPIYVDHDMWEKIVLNLLSNALKFTFEGKISVALRWRGECAEMVVNDTGVGIAKSELPRLFERFHRVEGTRARTHEGSGIGLALVHELVRLHGGSIDVSSRVDAGTTFTISLPRGSSHLNPERIRASSSVGSTPAATAYVEEALRWVPSADSPGSAAPKANGTQAATRILVADDNADMREYITRLLRQHWEVEEVADGVEALRAARRCAPDLILSDVMMPHLDGFGLIRELRGAASTATIPIVLLSARAGEEATAEGLRAGADDYLVKPFSASALLVRVEAQLSAARLRETLRRNARAESERLQTIFQESPAAIGVLRGPEFVIELANALLLRMWGKTSAVIGQPLLEGVPELRGQGFDQRLREVLESGIPYHGKEALARLNTNHDGVLQDHYFDFVYAPFPGSEGALSGVFVHAYEVTDKVLARKSSEQLRCAELRARQDAEAANRLKDEFLATMSHELRTPLNAILGWAALLQGGSDDRVALQRGLATIERNARSQARLIEDVLDVSRIISGKLRLDVRRVDAISIARAALDVVRPAAVARKVRLTVEHGPEDVLELVGDADRLQQVIWNLVSNAVKFTPSEGSVSVRVERRQNAIQIVVRDTGTGIAREHLPFIFERFRQVDSSTTRQYGGLGLGLAIVRHLVELHGGSVTAESRGLGHGSTFTVQLPVLVHTNGEHGNEVSESDFLREARFGLTSLSGIKLLIVDDDEDSRFVLERALERAGATVIGAESAALALELLELHTVDILVSDIGMPGEDGFSLMKSLRSLPGQRGGAIPAIALTAYVRTEDVTRALEVGFQRHLAKPVDLEELARTVTTLLEQARSAGAAPASRDAEG